jgi:azurin
MGSDYAQKSFSVLAGFLQQGQHVPAAARAITQLPRTAWEKQQATAIAEAILAWAKMVPANQRTSQDFIEAAQVGDEIAGLTPGSATAAIRKDLRALGVRVFVVKTVREQMRYDTPRLVVEAGKPFQVIFENLDMMPHNLVFVQPGAREEVGLQAQNMSPTPDRQGRIYIPRNKKIIAFSKLLEAGQKETLHLTAPDQPGDYEYVCTYPEHWKVMFGKLLVVKDIDSFLSADAPEPDSQAQAGKIAHQHRH